MPPGARWPVPAPSGVSRATTPSSGARAARRSASPAPSEARGQLSRLLYGLSGRLPEPEGGSLAARRRRDQRTEGGSPTARAGGNHGQEQDAICIAGRSGGGL